MAGVANTARGRFACCIAEESMASVDAGMEMDEGEGEDGEGARVLPRRGDVQVAVHRR